MKKFRTAMAVGVLVLMGAASPSQASFKDCYTKCFIFCMIEPSQTLCSCTTHCLKDCIFQEIQNDDNGGQEEALAFCKLGCAFSMCSRFTTKGNPNGDKVDGCVGSCSGKCSSGYYSSP